MYISKDAPAYVVLVEESKVGNNHLFCAGVSLNKRGAEVYLNSTLNYYINSGGMNMIYENDDWDRSNYYECKLAYPDTDGIVRIVAQISALAK